MDRNGIRGVTAALVAATLALATLVGAEIARGAERDNRYSTPLSAQQQQALLHWRLPRVPYLRHRLRPLPTRASRASYRAPLDPRSAAHAMLARQGGSEAQWSCLDTLWSRESNWNVVAANPSGAYGIPQALPGAKMAGFGSD